MTFSLFGLFFVTAFYCRDPDTGKFYPVNTTWSSTTFCGSYTCKVRKLNYTAQRTLLREIKIIDATSKRLNNELSISQLKASNRTNDKGLSGIQNYNKTQTDLHEKTQARDNTSPERTNYPALQDLSKEKAKEKITFFKKKVDKLEVLLDDKIKNIVNESVPRIYKDNQKYLDKATHNKKFKVLYNGRTEVAQKKNDKEMMVRKNIEELNIINQTEPQKVSTSKDDDRYLTADEITALTSILQNVKKSDVEAIIEVYNLAQDIYKEIDKNTDQGVVNDLQNIQSNGKDSKFEKPIKSVSNDHISYWYEPLSHSNNKQKVVQIDTSKLVPVLPPNPKKETHTVPVPPIIMKTPKEEGTANKDTTRTSDAIVPNYTYLIGPLSNNNFRKLPYYPTAGIQKQVNYGTAEEYFQQLPGPPEKISSIKIPGNTGSLTGLIAEFPVTKRSFIKSPCKLEHFKHTTGEDILTKKTTMNKNKISFMDNPKALLAPFMHLNKKSPTVLPYPFAYIKYNLSSIPNPYFTANPFHLFNIRPQTPLSKKTQMPPDPEFVAGLPKAILTNPNLNGDVQVIEQNPVEVILRQENKMPSWLLSQSILNEDKANVIPQLKLRPIPIRKNMKVERLSKVIKMDELKRPIRDTTKKDLELKKEVPEELEVYLEKSK